MLELIVTLDTTIDNIIHEKLKNARISLSRYLNNLIIDSYKRKYFVYNIF